MDAFLLGHGVQSWQEDALEWDATSIWENQICSHFLLDKRGTVALCPVLQPAPVSPAADNHNHMCHICAKEFLDHFLNFN